MKNLNEVLKQKEADLQRLQQEIEALKTAMRLCADERDAEPMPLKRAAGAESNAPKRQFP